MDSRMFLVFLSLAVVTLAGNVRLRVKRQINPNALLPYFAQQCANNPNGNNSQAFLVGHPDWCNAYVTCEPPTAHAQCHFCGEGLYFPEGPGTCVALHGAEPQSLCNGRQFAQHREKVYIIYENRCSALQQFFG